MRFKKFIIRTKSYLIEKSFKQIDASDIITRDFVDAVYTSDENDSFYKVHWNIEQGKEDEYEDIPKEEEKEYKEWLYGQLEDRQWDVECDLGDIIKNGKVMLYRVMTVRRDWVDHLKK